MTSACVPLAEFVGVRSTN